MGKWSELLKGSEQPGAIEEPSGQLEELSIGETLGGAVKSAIPSTGRALVDLASGGAEAGKIALGGVEKGFREAKELITGEEKKPFKGEESFDQAIAGAKTIFKGAASKVTGGDAPEEAIIDQIGQMFKDKYGTVANLKKTIAENPVDDFLVDIASVIAPGGSLIKGVGAVSKSSKIAKAGADVAKFGAKLEPINVVRQAAAPIFTKIIPKEAPTDFYLRGVKFKTTLPDKVRKELANTAIDQRVMATSKGLDKLREGITADNTKLDNLINKVVERGDEVTTQELIKDLDKLAKSQRHTGEPTTFKQAVQRVKKQRIKADTIYEKYKKLVPIETKEKLSKEGNKFLKKVPVTKKKASLKPHTLAEVQELKKSIYRTTGSYYASAMNSPASVQAQHKIANNAKKIIEKLIPEAKGINASEKKKIGLLKAIEQSSNRISQADISGIKKPTSMIAGQLAGEGLAEGGGKVGAVLGLASGIITDPNVQQKIAFTLDFLRNKGVKISNKATLIRLGLMQAGDENE